MAHMTRSRAAIKFLFWTAAAAVLIAHVAQSYRSGRMARWFYYSAAIDGYAVNADVFRNASKEQPARLRIVPSDRIDGLVAVPVKQGDLLPANATGVISTDILKKGKRASLEGGGITVSIPWEIQQSKGFKFKDTFKHKGVETYPWSAVWNVLITLGLGLCLGYMAEGFTDLLGYKLERIRHFEGH